MWGKPADRFLLAAVIALLLASVVSPRRMHHPEPAPANETALEQKMPVAMSQQAVEAKLRDNPALRARFEQASTVSFVFIFLSLFYFLQLFAALIFRRLVLKKTPPVELDEGFLWVFRALAGSLAVLLLFPWVVAAAHRLFPGWSLPKGPVESIFATFCVNAFLFFLLAWRFWGPGLLPPLEKEWRRRFWAVGTAVRWYLALVPVLFAVIVLSVLAFRAAGIEGPNQEIFQIYLSEARGPALGLLNILIVLVGPVTEELFFRGAVYRSLKPRAGVRGALILSAALFAALHMDLVSFVPIFTLGLLFGWVYEQTGSLAAPITIHLLHNALMLYFASLVKDLLS